MQMLKTVTAELPSTVLPWHRTPKQWWLCWPLSPRSFTSQTTTTELHCTSQYSIRARRWLTLWGRCWRGRCRWTTRTSKGRLLCITRVRPTGSGAFPFSWSILPAPSPKTRQGRLRGTTFRLTESESSWWSIALHSSNHQCRACSESTSQPIKDPNCLLFRSLQPSQFKQTKQKVK